MASSNNTTEAVDRISNLPMPIIHHIMSFLETKYATRTSTLSKRWRSIFYSFPIVDIDQYCFDPSLPENMSCFQRREKFLSYLYDSISRRLDQENNIQKFRLQTDEYDLEYELRIEFSINFAVKRNVQDLDLSIIQNMEYLTLPRSVYKARSIVSLKLRGFKLKSLPNLLSGCPQIEHLSLRYCDGLRNVRISSEKFKTLELVCCQVLMFIEIEAINLQSFLYNGEIRPCKINLSACRYLKDLCMQQARITDNWLEEHLSKLVLLENLALEDCTVLKKVKVVHKKLRKFRLVECRKVEEVHIDAPMLISFMYQGNIIIFGSLNSSGLLKATLALPKGDATIEWFVKLWDLLKFFGHCKVLKLDYFSDEDVMFPEDLKYALLPPLYDLKHLQIEVLTSTALNYTELVDTSLWFSPHLETLHIASNGVVKSVKFHYEKIAEDDQEPYCCEANPAECWKNHLKKVTMENFDGVDDEKEKLLKYFSNNAKLLESVQVNSETFEVSREVCGASIVQP